MAAPTFARLFDEVSRRESLDRPADLVARVGRGTPRRIADLAQRTFGHPLHPALTDLPIGFWTSAWVLDLLPGRTTTSIAARRLIGLGVVSTVPTVLSGLGDAAAMERPERRTAALHGMCNGLATAAFAWSWWLRRNGPTGTARTLAHVGATLATVGGLLGGHLAFPPENAGEATEAPSATIRHETIHSPGA